ncbi:hypothetical protein NCCP2331_19500 [Sporosarcina sp. NCCP-2331]|nr:hypothetical protein NCCP2331_19500 [Sporosarcina sp. NCCP-2331]GLB55921.1 hypothetical protein NCCP2378_17080 [Sporosarcina sp. NCCP-2378]
MCVSRQYEHNIWDDYDWLGISCYTYYSAKAKILVINAFSKSRNEITPTKIHTLRKSNMI